MKLPNLCVSAIFNLPIIVILFVQIVALSANLLLYNILINHFCHLLLKDRFLFVVLLPLFVVVFRR